MKGPIIVFCKTLSGRHRWRWVLGVMATIEHPYRERQCERCYVRESKIR